MNNFSNLSMDYENISTIKKENSPTENDSAGKLVTVRIITGVLVFEPTTSSGHLNGSFWYETMLGKFNSIYINTLGVLSEFRKTGLASFLLDWLIRTTEKQTELKFIYLHVIDYNTAAIRLYHKMGFQQL